MARRATTINASMTDVENDSADEISLFALATTVVQNRWRLARWTMLGAILAALSALWAPLLYVASVSFVPQGADPSRSGLASLAGQFGFSVASGNQSTSPEFYSNLLKSRVVLGEVVRDTFAVAERAGRRFSFLDLFEIPPGTASAREERGMRQLSGAITSSVDRTTGVVQVTVATPWRSVSLRIAAALIDAINEYNQRTRQGQAAAERRFIDGRLALARTDLREAEDRLSQFLSANKQIGNSAELTFQRDRLQREVNLRQEVFTTLTQAYEDVRIREVRDTPVITVFEPPSVSADPAPRGRLMRVAFGLLAGAFVGLLLIFFSDTVARRKDAEDADVSQLIRALADAKQEILRRLRWRSHRSRP